MVQGGDPTGTGRGGESIYGGKFADEVKRELKHTGTMAEGALWSGVLAAGLFRLAVSLSLAFGWSQVPGSSRWRMPGRTQTARSSSSRSRRAPISMGSTLSSAGERLAAPSAERFLHTATPFLTAQDFRRHGCHQALGTRAH